MLFIEIKIMKIMKVFCKKTLFIEKKLIWQKNNIYECKYPNNFEKNYIYLHIKYEHDWIPLNKKKFNEYFENIEDHRNSKINKILKD